MINHEQSEQLITTHAPVFSVDGTHLGAIHAIYIDDYTGLPSFAGLAVTTTTTTHNQQVLVALHEADLRDGRIHLPYSRTFVNHAPTTDGIRPLDTDEEDALFVYYGVPIEDISLYCNHTGLSAMPQPNPIA